MTYHSTTSVELNHASNLINEGKLEEASNILRSIFEKSPEDVNVLRLLAELGKRRGHLKDSAELLRRAIMIHPDGDAARFDLLSILMLMHKHEEAMTIIDNLLKRHTENLQLMSMKANILMRLGENLNAISYFEKILTRDFDLLGVWMMYGHCLKSVGRLSDSINAYREALLLDPCSGDAWWSLANIKTFKFDLDDIKKMEDAINTKGRNIIDRASLHFALAKALEDNNQNPESSFNHYKIGNELRRSTIKYDRDFFSEMCNKFIKFQSKEFFKKREGQGFLAASPIFVLGMPRSGSTLIEQILASHPQIEATNELHDIISIANRLSKGKAESNNEGINYLDRLARLNAGQLKALGEEYIERTAIQRKTDKPFFIDKMPVNWRHIGLIHLILPNAKIIDTRRHPLDCCLSNFKQHYGMGHHNSYDLVDMGQFYVDYVKYLAHMDEVLPGKIYRVVHENLIENPDNEIRKIFEYLQLPFHENCLNFWESDRVIKTPSSEQVRRPINRDGMNQWKKYEPWLDPLKNTLGEILVRYPSVPLFN